MKKRILPIVMLLCSFSLFSQTAGTLTVTYSTKTISSQTESFYAIYITNASGTLINTLAYKTSNGNGSASGYLTVWWSLIGQSTSGAKFVGSTDGISGATATSFVTAQKVYWGRTTSVATVPDGTYTVNFIIGECTSGGGSVQGNTRYSGTFVKGAAVASSTVTTPIAFANVSLAWAPVNTAVDNVEADKMYSVYPNPAISSIYVSGSDIKTLDICSLSGQSILHSAEQRVNISSLPKGNYLVIIKTSNASIIKKIQKL